ncbi:MAG: hypothetical protein ACFFB0_19130 [Promethearchaeota archaeon]
MSLCYEYIYGNLVAEGLIIEQFLCFNSNLQTMFVYIPLVGIVMA